MSHNQQIKRAHAARACDIARRREAAEERQRREREGKG